MASSAERMSMMSSENITRGDMSERYNGWDGLPSVDELVPLNKSIITPVLACAFSINQENHRQERSEADAEKAAQATLDNLYENIKMAHTKAAEVTPVYANYSLASDRSRGDQIPSLLVRDNTFRVSSNVPDQVEDTTEIPGRSSLPGQSSRSSFHPDLRLSLGLDDSPSKSYSKKTNEISSSDYSGWRRIAEEGNIQPREHSDRHTDRELVKKEKPASKEAGDEEKLSKKRESDKNEQKERKGSKDKKENEDSVPDSESLPDEDKEEEGTKSKTNSPDSGPKPKKSKNSQDQEENKRDRPAQVDSGSRKDSSPNSNMWMDGNDIMTDDGTKTIKRPRLVWTPQLHRRFVEAVSHLGLKNAVPKTIMQLMNVNGLTRENVASHLQKYRLYLKRLEGSPDTPMTTEQLFASTPVPPSHLTQQQPPQVVHYFPRADAESVLAHPGSNPASRTFILGQYPAGVPFPAGAIGAGFDAYSAGYRFAAPLREEEGRRGDSKEDRENDRDSKGDSSPKKTVLSLFPGGE